MSRSNHLFRMIISIMMIFFIVAVHNVVYANDLMNKIDSDIDNFNKHAEQNQMDISGVTKEFSDLGQVLTLIGTGIYIAVIAYMGIKYMTSNPESRAKLKMQLIGVLVSGIVLFGAYNIWCMAIDIFN